MRAQLESRAAASSHLDASVLSLIQAGNYAVAEAKAKAALARQPKNHALKKALTACLLHQSKSAEALQVCQQLIKDTPKDWECWANLAFCQRLLDNWPAAIEAYHKALEIKPDQDHLCSELALMYRATNQNHLALQWFFNALKADPDSRQHFLNWTDSLTHLRKLEEAFSCLVGAWEDEPEEADLAVALIPAAAGLAEWQILRETEDVFYEHFKQGRCEGLAPLALLCSSRATRQLQRQFVHGRVAAGLNASFPRRALKPVALSGEHKPLRIGYLSADIFNHATAFLINGVLLAHQAVGLECYMYSYGPDDKQAKRKEIEEGVSVFRDVQMCSADQIADTIVADSIDILVDLKGWTKDYRVEIQALRPAPVVVSWLGYPGTLGHERLADYIIGDPVVTPLAHADGYSEKIAQMPHSYQPNDNRRPLPPKTPRVSVGLPEEAFVFCSFNRVDKLTEEMFERWCRILAAVPGSVLWLLSDFERAQNNLRAYAATHGVAPERLIFAPSMSLDEHMARLQCADLALDSFPYTSHTTGSDALWAGVPLLALQGETFASRVSASLLNAAGLPELVTHSLDEFEALAIALATDTTRLQAVRSQLVAARSDCPLFDTARFARDLARLYREIWKNQQSGQHGAIALSPGE